MAHGQLWWSKLSKLCGREQRSFSWLHRTTNDRLILQSPELVKQTNEFLLQCFTNEKRSRSSDNTTKLSFVWWSTQFFSCENWTNKTHAIGRLLAVVTALLMWCLTLGREFSSVCARGWELLYILIYLLYTLVSERGDVRETFFNCNNLSSNVDIAS